MATITETNRQNKVTSLQKQTDGSLLVTVETTITRVVTLAPAEWLATDAHGKQKAKGKPAILAIIAAAVKAAKA
jgi:hypothetical protein